MTGHPYDPLTADEITTAVAAVLTTRTELTEPRFPLVRTDLPAKETLRAPHDNPERAALLVVYDRADAATYEATVHLASSTVTAWRHVPGVQPAIMIEEIMELDAI